MTGLIRWKLRLDKPLSAFYPVLRSRFEENHVHELPYPG